LFIILYFINIITVLYIKKYDQWFKYIELWNILNILKKEKWETEFADLIKEKNELYEIQSKLEIELQEIFYPSTIKIILVPFDKQEFTISIDYSNLDNSKYEELLKIINRAIFVYNPKFRQLLHLTKIEALKLVNNMEELKINIETRKFNIWNI